MTKLLLLFLINFTTIISISIGGVEIAALLQAFGYSVGLCGLANVLQCGIAKTTTAKKCGRVKI
jgi:hypothetical protein